MENSKKLELLQRLMIVKERMPRGGYIPLYEKFNGNLTVTEQKDIYQIWNGNFPATKADFCEIVISRFETIANKINS